MGFPEHIEMEGAHKTVGFPECIEMEGAHMGFPPERVDTIVSEENWMELLPALALDMVEKHSQDSPLAGMQLDLHSLKQRVERLQEENSTLRERQSRRPDADTTTASEAQLKMTLKQTRIDAVSGGGDVGRGRAADKTCLEWKAAPRGSKSGLQQYVGDSAPCVFFGGDCQ